MFALIYEQTHKWFRRISIRKVDTVFHIRQFDSRRPIYVDLLTVVRSKYLSKWIYMESGD